MRASLFNHLDLFSGIGGFALGARQADLQVKRHYFSDVSEHANTVYQKQFPCARPLGDVRSIDGRQLGRHRGHWLITGGFPCQDISNAGPRDGIGGRRSGLWWEMHRLVGELRPAFVVAENVPALCNRGLERVLLSLADLGYDAEWEVVSAASIGAPHVRKRIWIVAYPNLLRRVAAGQVHARGQHVGNGQHSDGPAARDLPWADWQAITAGRQMGGEPLVSRMDDGLSDRLDRVHALGNAVIPQLVAQIFRRLLIVHNLPKLARA